ncbi:MAG: cupin domain-containing protein [bacterium]|nr:cupin domain-containing protein [bacterium]
MRLERIAWAGGGAPTEAALRRTLEAEGFRVWGWTDGPGASYAPHSHDHDESLWVVAGEITFGAEGQSLRLGPGDRLMLPCGTVHTALAGPAGATYLVGER